RPACSAATVAANGVDFFDPLKPALPALPHATTFPCRSVIVIRVLLNVALMWAMPSASTLLRLLFVRAPFFGFAMRRVPLCCPYLCSRYPAARRPIRQSGRPSLHPGRQAGAGAGRLLPRRLLLARDRAARTLVRARIRVRALTAHRKAAAVPQSAVTADVHQPLDVHRDFRAQRTLDLVPALDLAAQPVDLVVRQLVYATVRVHTGRGENLLRRRQADAIDVRESDLDPLVARQIHTRNTRHMTNTAAACAADSSCR